MGLFDKKYCDICGQAIGLLGNRKLEDGNCCKDCASKLSPFFSDRRRSTVEDIKRQLAYREENKKVVATVNPTLVLGYDSKKLYVDEAKGVFFVTASSNWKNANPDIIPLRAVSSVQVEVTEDADEVTKEDENGNDISYDPQRFTYEYKFEVIISVSTAWFDTIRFEVSNFGSRPTSPYAQEYTDCANACHAVRCALLPNMYTKDNVVAFDKNECSFVPTNPENINAYPGTENANTMNSGADVVSAFFNALNTAVNAANNNAPVNNVPVNNGYNAPVNNGYGAPVNNMNAPVNNGYVNPVNNMNAPVNNGYVNPVNPVTPVVPVNQVPVQATPDNGSWFCPNCGTATTGNFCVNCGTAKPVVVNRWFCPNCGTQVEGNFCTNCGTRKQ